MAGLLPGLRDLRTPFSVGVLWALIAAWWIGPDTDRFLAGGARVRWDRVAELLPAGVALGIAASAIYVLGAVVIPAQNYALHLVETRLRQICRMLVHRRRAIRPRVERAGRPGRWTMRLAERVAYRLLQTYARESADVERLLRDGASQTLVDVGVPGELASAFPGSHLVFGLQNIAPQLAQVSADQAQDWDRLQTEAEFRRALVVPIGVALVSAALTISWVFLPLVLVAPPILLGQAYRRRRAAEVVVASAVYSRKVVPPVLVALKSEIERTAPDRAAGLAEWFATLIIGARRAGDEMLSYGLIDEARRVRGDLSQLAEVPELIVRRDSTATHLADYVRQRWQLR